MKNGLIPPRKRINAKIQIKDNPWSWLAIIVIIILTVLAYMVIWMHVHKTDQPKQEVSASQQPRQDKPVILVKQEPKQAQDQQLKQAQRPKMPDRSPDMELKTEVLKTEVRY